MDKSSSYVDVFAASHRKNQSPVRVWMKPKTGRAVTEKMALSVCDELGPNTYVLNFILRSLLGFGRANGSLGSTSL